jgi:DNA-binding protein HU-beta
MTKIDLIDFIYKKNNGLTKNAITKIIKDVFDCIQESIKYNDKFSYPGFGTFVLRNRKQRKGRNPRTGKNIIIKASNTVGFKPAKAFKTKL